MKQLTNHDLIARCELFASMKCCTQCHKLFLKSQVINLHNFMHSLLYVSYIMILLIDWSFV